MKKEYIVKSFAATIAVAALSLNSCEKNEPEITIH